MKIHCVPVQPPTRCRALLGAASLSCQLCRDELVGYTVAIVFSAPVGNTPPILLLVTPINVTWPQESFGLP